MAISTTAAGLSFYVPVSALFLMDRGQSLSDIFIFESILVATIMLTEIPAGLVADRIDRRFVIIAGFVLNAVAEILFASSGSFVGFAVSFAISGAGIAMLTGVQEAYIYDSLGPDADRASVGVYGQLSSLDLIAGVGAAVVGGLLAEIDIGWPAVAAATAAVLAAAAACFLPSQLPEPEDAEQELESALTHLATGIRVLFTTPILLYVAVASSASFVLFNAVFTLNQPLFSQAEIPVAVWGVIGGGAQLVAALYNHHAGRIEHALGRKYALFVAMSFGVVGFILMATPQAPLVILGFVLVVLGMNARGPITTAVANRVIPRGRRATVLNVASSIGSLVGIAANPVIGAGADASTTLTVVAIGGVLLVVAVTWILVANRYLDEPSAEEESTPATTV
ncbi:MFS transporter [Arthrobacter echini]|uniref:MFS transporter n=1 Tax=Arthrobacter echini TaxID=1529066 RepID=A0A4S5E2H5_9MICC|nr:MFS transporter [Arthrobacter echini]